MRVDTPECSDALVLFGATGDLARKKLFPAIYHLARKGFLDGVGNIGVASRPWDDDQLRKFARVALGDRGGDVDEAVWDRLAPQLRYVSGDYRDAATFERLRDALVGHQRRCSTWPSRRRLVPAAVGRGHRVGFWRAPGAWLVQVHPFLGLQDLRDTPGSRGLGTLPA